MTLLDTKDAVIENARGDDSAVHPRGSAKRWPILIPIAATVLLLLPFLRKAFTIDDPLFVWAAEQILKHPLDPYGFDVSWLWAWEAPMAQQMQNPPLNSYFIAVVARLIGLSELRLHAAFLLPAIAVSSGTYLIAKRFCTRPIWATLAAILTPAFLVSGSTVMCDMMMLAFWMWAVVFWLNGMDEDRPWMIALACVFITLSALTKYFGIALLPMLLAYTLLVKRRLGGWMLGSLIPVAALIAYHYWTKSLYGVGLMMDAFRMSGELRSFLGSAVLQQSILGLGFTGGCIASVIFLAPLLWSRRALLGWIGLAVALSLLFGKMGEDGNTSLKLARDGCWLVGGHLGVFVTAGISLVVLAIKDLIAKRDADSVLLFLWFMGTIIFVSALNWTVNGRVLLPLAPVAGIIMIRQIERRRPRGMSPARISFALPLVLSAVLALGVTHADMEYANSQRTVAQTVYKDFPVDGTTWFTGHWGFQYYMQRLGARAYNSEEPECELGDLLVFPYNNTGVSSPPELATGTTGEFAGSRWLSTMSRGRGTSFHSSDMWGPIPYGFGLTSPEYYIMVPVDEGNIDVL